MSEVTLITGGTGTLGQALVKQLTGEVRIFSRNELLQVEMKRKYPDLKYIIGDVRDYKALKEATKGVNIIYHLASIKHVSICEQQPLEALKTNVYGTYNVIKAAKRNGCRVVFISTDKAENPISFYGMTKLMAENLIKKAGFLTIRSGNIFGSSGSVIPLFISQVGKEITLTNGNMTRFFILASELAKFLIYIADYEDDKIFAPPMKSFTMRDVAECVSELYGETVITQIGQKAGEKMHESILGVSSLDCLADKDELKKMFQSWSSST